VKASTQESTQFLCEILDLSKAGFYDWRRRNELPDCNDALRSKIVTLHKKTKGRYGVARIYNGLKNEGETASRNRVHRQMKQLGLRGKVKKRFIPKTTINDPSQGKSPRLFEGKATPVTRPNEVWVGDISYIYTREGFLYLAIWLDIFSRVLVGWSLEDHMEESLVSSALKKAVSQRRIKVAELKLAHTDQGSQYEAKLYRVLLGLFKIEQSMSRKGNCYDNAFAETFFKTLKNELEFQVFETKEQARQHIFEFIEAWYNTERIHSSLGFISPADYEKKYYESRQVA
jgi:transposase InsO family protein